MIYAFLAYVCTLVLVYQLTFRPQLPTEFLVIYCASSRYPSLSWWTFLLIACVRQIGSTLAGPGLIFLFLRRAWIWILLGPS
jgi:hypothetical protein